MKKTFASVIRNKIVGGLLSIFVFLGLAFTNLGSTAQAVSPTQPCETSPSSGDTTKLLILLQGLNTKSSKNNEVWQNITGEVGRLYGAISYYSYKDGSSSYDVADTGTGVQGHVDRLKRMIDNCRSQYATIDLIGHSLGGVVAFDYIKQNGSIDGRVRHVITLDSPINGSYNLCSINFSDVIPDICRNILANIADAVTQILWGYQSQSVTGVDLGQRWQQQSTIVPENLTRVKELRRMGIVVYTLTNRDDGVIYKREALTA